VIVSDSCRPPVSAKCQLSPIPGDPMAAAHSGSATPPAATRSAAARAATRSLASPTAPKMSSSASDSGVASFSAAGMSSWVSVVITDGTSIAEPPSAPIMSEPHSSASTGS
jgi:hypothetical protein